MELWKQENKPCKHGISTYCGTQRCTGAALKLECLICTRISSVPEIPALPIQWEVALASLVTQKEQSFSITPSHTSSKKLSYKMVPLSSLGSECRAMFLNRTAVGEGYKHSSVPYFSIKIPTSSQCEGVGTKKNFCGPPAPEQLILYLKNQGSINRFDPSKWSLWQRASVQLSSVPVSVWIQICAHQFLWEWT